MKLAPLCCAAALAAALVPAPGAAAGLGPLEVHGFVSQGYVKSSDNRWSTLDTEEGSFAWTEEALNVNAEPLENLRIGMQLFGRDFGAVGNHELVVDWALGDYLWRRWLGVRLGKIKLPFGLYNELMDADMARPEILQPIGIYSINQRDLINAYEGLGLYGTVGLGRGGELEYELHGGTMDIDEAYVVRLSLEDGVRAGLAPLAPLGIDAVALGDIEARMNHTYGGTLTWNAPLAGLRLRGGLSASDSDFSVDATYTGWADAGGQPVPLSLATRTAVHYEEEYNAIVGAEYQRGPLRLSAEYWQQRVHLVTAVSGLPFPVPETAEKVTTVSYYAQAAYHLTERLQASTYYSVLYMDADDRDGDKYVRMGQQADRAWLKDLALTLRFDLTPWWLLKLEVHAMDGTATLRPVDNPDGLERDWWLFAAKTTFHF